MAPIRGRKTPQNLGTIMAATSTTSGGAGTLNQLLEVVTSVTQGLEYEDETQLAEIFPDLSVDFIKVASNTQSELKLKEKGIGPLTRARQGQYEEKFLEMFPNQIGLARADPSVEAALELPNGPRQALLERRREAEIEAILRLERPFLHKFCIPDVKPIILNVVASANVGMPLDLKKIGQGCANVEFNPKRFAPCVLRIRNPKCTALVFSSGRMIVSGCKSEEECKFALRKFARHIEQRLGLDRNTLFVLHFEVQNISANAALRWPVRLKTMAEDPSVKKFVSYEAELFPGLVFSLVQPKIKIVIFVTGALLMTGLRSEKDLGIAMEIIFPICRRFRG